MSTLTAAFKKSASKNSGGKNAQWYNAEKKKLMTKGAVSQVDEVRMFFASNNHTPTTILSLMIKKEQDHDILRAVLMNGNVSRKAVAEFVGDATNERVAAFEGDEEVIARFTRQ